VPDDAPDLADFMNDDGTAELAGRKLKDSQDEKAVEESQEEKLPDTDDSGDSGEDDVYALKGKSLEEKKQVFERMADELDLESMSQRDIAGKTDVSKTVIFNSGRLLDQIEEEYGTRYGL
jgi:hypothetical protein